MRPLLSILLLFCFTHIVNAQDEYIIRFDVTRSANRVVIEFVTSAEFTCENLSVLHGTTKESMTVIHLFPGICGTIGTEEHYLHVVSNLDPNRHHFFALDLGRYGQTDPDSVYISGSELALSANPATAAANILIDNPLQEMVRLSLIDVNGSEISSLSTRQSSVPLSRFNVSKSGLYILKAEIAGRLVYVGFFYLG